MFLLVSGYEYGMVPAQVEVVLFLRTNYLCRVHSLTVQAGNTICQFTCTTSKAGYSKKRRGDTKFLPAWLEVYEKDVFWQNEELREGSRMVVIPKLDFCYRDMNGSCYLGSFLERNEGYSRKWDANENHGIHTERMLAY